MILVIAMERNSDLKTNSRILRKNQTKEEALLWYNFLRKYPLNFRRQYIIGNYIVDFYCHKARLVVELDGSQHCEPDKAEYDRQRTAYLHSQGLAVLRFSNLDVLRQFDNVCSMIHASAQQRTKIPSPGGGAPRSES